jgi:hypothetical protein
MYDILNNYTFGYFQHSVADSAGAAANAPDDNGIDLWANSQLPNRVLLIIDIGSVGSGGTLDLIVQDSPDQSTWDVDFLTIAQITEAGLFLVEIFDPERYVRLNVTVGTDTVNWSALYMTFENQRRPVTQIGTALTPTYGTGRKPKVGGAIT